MQWHLWEERCGIAAVASFAVFAVLYLQLGEIPRAIKTSLGLFVILALVTWFIGWRRWQILQQWKAAKCPVLAGLGRRTLEISDDTLTERSDQHTFTLHWSLIRRIVYRPRHLYFLLLDESALVVPFDTITPPSDRDRFLDFLRQCAPPELRGELSAPA
jgi:hypothetical protein